MITYRVGGKAAPKDPNQWPTADKLTDGELIRQLLTVELADRDDREAPTQDGGRRRHGINTVHTDLFTEAVQRGLRDPYK